jgi:hypothetical protein
MNISNLSELYSYPSFSTVNAIISNSIEQLAEYSFMNHDCLKTIWNNFNNKELIRKQGQMIYERGGIQAMRANFYTFIHVLGYTLNKDETLNDEDKQDIWTSKRLLESYWDGIGEWQC